MKRECRRRERLRRFLGKELSPVDIIRPVPDLYGQPDPGRGKLICCGDGHRYYKYEQTKFRLTLSGKTCQEKTERILFCPIVRNLYVMTSFVSLKCPILSRGTGY